MTLILDGKKVQDELAVSLAREIGQLATPLTLAIIQVGDNPASNVYIEQKKKFGDKIGAKVELFRFEEKTTQAEVEEQIEKLNQDPATHGIIIQLPLPDQFYYTTPSEKRRSNLLPSLLEKIKPEKDVDGLTSASTLMPATARAVLTLLDYYQIPIKGKKVAVIGRSRLVGGPTAVALEQRGATVAVCHRGTPDLGAETHQADIIIVATGSPKLLRAEHLTPGREQVVIDVGITRTAEGLVGDTDFENIKDLVAAISPVPGGVGPLTVASLFLNLLEVYHKA